MATRRSFLFSGLKSAVWLSAGVGGAWLLRDQVFWPTPDADAVEGGPSSAWLPFAAPGALVALSAAINGAPVTALLDTGAQYSAVDAAYAALNGLVGDLAPPLVAFGVGGDAQLGRGARFDVSFDGMSVRDLRAASLRLGPIAQAVGRPVPLIIGQNLLQALVVEIDFPGRRLRLHRSGAYAPPLEAVPAEARRVGGAVHAKVVVEGAPVEALVDTGSSAVLAVSSEVARTLGLLDGRPMRANQSVVLGGVQSGGVVQADRLEFGDRVLRDVGVQIFPQIEAPGFPTALLGVGAFRRRRVILDLRRGTMHLLAESA